jgi:23S rRNA pseudouridine1911/1915/1917 synthase
VPPELAGRPLDRVVRALSGAAWNEARGWIRSGKVRVGDALVTDPTRVVHAGERVQHRSAAPRPEVARVRAVEAELFVYVDAAIVVVRKPAFMSTVPFGDEPSDETTLDALVREALARRDKIRGRAPLGVVQRLDKGTTGLLVFARSVEAKQSLAQQLRVHTVHRRYLAIAHGVVASGTHRSYLVADRGDGLRGSARRGQREGQLAVTHVEALERLAGATLVGCRLETGRTHQIRVHLAEGGNPLVGENVYVREHAGPRIAAARPMLHAAELGFDHPSNGRPMRFSDPPPADFAALLASLRR